MQSKYSVNTTVKLSQCDSTKRLGIPAAFSAFMDAATEHAKLLQVSDRELSPRGLFWIVVRTKAHFYFRPDFMEDITVTTWPEAAGRVRCVRNYLIENGGEIAVAAKSEWAIIELESGKLQSTKGIYPEGLILADDNCPVEPFTRINESFEESAPFAEYTVRSTDIDFGGHMNNAAYIRALASVFSSEQWAELGIKDIEIAYKNQCYEGESLRLHRKNCDNGVIIGFVLPDGRVAATVKILN